MKIRGRLIVLCVTVSMPYGLLAQSDVEPKQAEPKSRPAAETSKRILEELSDEERQGLRAAVNEIWHADEVEKRRQSMLDANLAYRRALQQEIHKMDVSKKLRSVLLQLLHYRFRQEGRTDDVAPRDVPANDRIASPQAEPLAYTAEERKIIDQARMRSEKLPAVVEAKRRLDMAITVRERHVASGNFRMVMRASMEKADPRVKRIFERRERGGGGNRPRALMRNGASDEN